MTTGIQFVIWDGNNISTLCFAILEGLMQGAVISPEIFNIFTFNIPILFNLNKAINTHSVAFADDYKMGDNFLGRE